MLAGLLALAVIPDQAILRPKIVWGRGLILVAACAVLASAALAGSLRLHWRKFMAVALLPGLLAVGHALILPLESASLARDEVSRLFLVPICAWLAALVLEGPRWRARFLLALSLAGIVVGGLALAQRLGGLVPLGVQPASRATAGFGNPVFLGAWLVASTPLLLAEALAEPGRGRWLAAIAAGLCLPALLASGSAGAWLGLAVALLVAVLLIVPASRALNVTLGGAGLGLAALLIMHPQVLLRPRTHGLIWRDTLAMILERPWGVGPGQYQVAFLPFASDQLLAAHPRSSVIINDAHSEPLQILAELGWPGLLVLVWVISALVAHLRRVLGAPAERAKDSVRLAAAMASVAGCLAMSFVSPDLRFEVTAVMLGLLIGFIASYDDAEELPLRGGRAARLAVLALAVLGLGSTVHAAWDHLSVARRLPPVEPLIVGAEDAVRLAKLREDVARYPDDPAVHYDLGTGLAGLRRFSEAADALERALALAPENPSVLRSTAVLSSLAGRFDRAVPLLERVLGQNPSDLQLRYLLAFSAFGRGDLRTAIQQCEQVLQVDPQHARARLLLQKLRE